MSRENDSNERTNINENYRHRHIDIDIPKNTIERRFYVPKYFEQTMNELDKILKREKKSLSQWIREQAQPYVNLHKLGNPQQLLKHYANGNTKPHIANDPCFFGCGRPSKFLAVYRGGDKKYKVCKVHADCINKNKLTRNFQFKDWKIIGEI